MNKLIHTIWFILLVYSSIAQSESTSVLFGNEWINFEQEYYKFYIEDNGIYRIDYNTLENAGIPIDHISGDDIRLYSLGQEVRIRVSTRGVFTVDDFIEFHGEKNDGSVDSRLYEGGRKDQLNPDYSLFVDERPYFFTWIKDIETEATGKRYEQLGNGLNGTGLPPEEGYYIHSQKIVFKDFYFKPSHNGRDFIRYSSFDKPEGYGSQPSHHEIIKIPTSEISSFGVDPRIILRFGTTILSRGFQIQINDKLLKSISQSGYGVVEVDEKFPIDWLSGDTIKIEISGLNEANEKMILASVEVQYPRHYIFTDLSYKQYLEQPSIIPRLVSIRGLTPFTPNPIVYNLDKGYFQIGFNDGSTVKFVSPSSFETNNLILFNPDQVNHISRVEKVEFLNTETSGNYYIITNDEFIEGGAEAYSDYRRSAEGGEYDVVTKNISSLFDQYGYGLRGHVLGLMNYLKYVRKENSDLKYIFIIGKGLQYPDNRITLNSSHVLIPTFGFPGSDNLLIAEDQQNYPSVPIGRLSATKNEDIFNYLEKIKIQENPPVGEQTLENQKWKKGVIHLSGGSADIQDLLFHHLKSMEEVIEKNKFGADVFTFRKMSADPIESAKSAEIISRIDAGSSIISFFGHSAVGTFDFSLENPKQYQNQGRNPIILSLGCYSGNIHTPFPGISEEFVLEKDVGAIAFIASSGTAYINPQFNTAIKIYDFLGNEMYGKPIGNIVQEALKNRSGDISIGTQTLIQQITLHGDPAYQYNTFKGPDYLIDYSSVRTEPSVINSATESFKIIFDVVNIGATQEEVLDLQLIHELPSGQMKDTIVVSMEAPTYKRSIEVELKNRNLDGVGVNKILINVDPSNVILESPSSGAEANNELTSPSGEKGYSFFILDNSAKPIYPENFAIVGDTGRITLKSGISNGLNPIGSFIIQIDTTESFNSPLLSEELIHTTKSIIEWTPEVSYSAGKVYYWRISAYTEENKSSQWRSSSFTFLPDHGPGWSQSHYFQWLKDDFNKLILDKGSRTLSFGERSWDIRIKNEMNDPTDFWVFVNGTPWASLNPKELAPLISIFAWNKSEVIFKNQGNDFGTIPFSSDGFLFYPDDPEDRKNIKELLESIPDGSRVFFHTILGDEISDLHIDEWEQDKDILGFTLFDVLESYGATRVRELQAKGTVPYTFIFDKGRGPVIEDVANNIFETIDLSSTGTSLWHEGDITSVALGPAKKWVRLEWEETKEESDATRLLIFGLKKSGQQKLLKDIVGEYSVNLANINSEIYPKLRLQYLSKDEINTTSAQLNSWRVLYTELPDAAIYSDHDSYQFPDTIDSGADLNLKFRVENITSGTLEPLLIRYRLVNNINEEIIVLNRTEKLDGNSSMEVEYTISTDGLGGEYQLQIELNPNEDQRELSDCNNFGFTTIFIREDDRNPFLDVTFNGRHLPDGAIITENPLIEITLLDEHSNVLLSNPEDFDIQLFYPDIFVWKVDHTDPGVQFFPATDLSNNRAQYIIEPNLNIKGTYRLKVQASDASGNFAGQVAYQVSFVVDDYNSTEPLGIYPNPMTDHVDIEYFLNGDLIPEVFIFNIYSRDGIRIKTIRKEDFGGLQRGLNSYRWNLRDGSGKPLPDGIYFYQLINSLDNSNEKKQGRLMVIR